MQQALQLHKWTGRSFGFGYTIDFIPFLIERLSATAPRIAQLISAAREEELADKPGGKWSIKEHIGHLADLEELHEGRLADFAQKAEVLRAADMTNRKTEEAQHNSMHADQLLAAFRAVRKHFFSKLQTLDDESMVRRALHPRLQQVINVADMLYFMAEHDNHHLTIMSLQLKGGNWSGR
jgi:uncharacterized damage-inducible protein DinB